MQNNVEDKKVLDKFVHFIRIIVTLSYYYLNYANSGINVDDRLSCGTKCLLLSSKYAPIIKLKHTRSIRFCATVISFRLLPLFRNLFAMCSRKLKIHLVLY